jgi:2'-5' RNA ligase
MIPVSDPPKGRMTVTGISLMKSERGKNGMIYTEL